MRGCASSAALCALILFFLHFQIVTFSNWLIGCCGIEDRKCGRLRQYVCAGQIYRTHGELLFQGCRRGIDKPFLRSGRIYRSAIQALSPLSDASTLRTHDRLDPGDGSYQVWHNCHDIAEEYSEKEH